MINGSVHLQKGAFVLVRCIVGARPERSWAEQWRDHQ
jgi:hypothetical protein